MKRFLKSLLVIFFIILSNITIANEFNKNKNDDNTTNPYIENSNITKTINIEDINKIKDSDKENEITNIESLNRISNKESSKLNKSGEEARNEANTPSSSEVNNQIDDISNETINKNGPFGVFYDTTFSLANVPSFFRSIKVAAYMIIINAITVMTGNIGATLSIYMGLFIISLATLQLVWNGFKYYVDITQQEQPVNIGGYLSQQIPYLIKVGVISAILMTNLYWYFYSILGRNLFITLGGVFGREPNITYALISMKLVKIMWMPVLLVLKSLVLALLIIPIFTGTFWLCLIMGFGMMGLVGRAVAEFVVIVIEYMVVGVFSIIVIPLALLDITRSFGGRMIGAMISAGINLIVATALVCFLTSNSSGLDLSVWTLLFNPSVAYFNLMLLFLLVTLLTKAKTIGNFIVKGQGATVKGSEVVTEGLMVAVDGIAKVVSIVTLVSGIGAAVGAAQAAMVEATKQAAKVGAKVAAEVGKAALKEGAKEGAKAAGKNGVKEIGKKAGKEAFKSTLKQGIKDTISRATSNNMRAKMVGNALTKLQQSDGQGVMGTLKDIGVGIARQNVMMGGKPPVDGTENVAPNIASETSTEAPKVSSESLGENVDK